MTNRGLAVHWRAGHLLASAAVLGSSVVLVAACQSGRAVPAKPIVLGATVAPAQPATTSSSTTSSSTTSSSTTPSSTTSSSTTSSSTTLSSTTSSTVAPGCEAVLQINCSGADVKRLQMLLNRKGVAHLSTDGQFGPRTAAALSKFESAGTICTSDGTIAIDGTEWKALIALPDAPIEPSS